MGATPTGLSVVGQSGQLTCKYPGCTKSCFSEAGKIHEFCGRTHAQKFKEAPMPFVSSKFLNDFCLVIIVMLLLRFISFLRSRSFDLYAGVWADSDLKKFQTIFELLQLGLDVLQFLFLPCLYI